MAELISEYFQRDLTEAEARSLSELLLDSPEDSLRWASLAEAAYRRYGLPEPQMPSDPKDWPRPSAGWGKWLGMSLFLMGLLGLILWQYPALKERLAREGIISASTSPKVINLKPLSSQSIPPLGMASVSPAGSKTLLGDGRDKRELVVSQGEDSFGKPSAAVIPKASPVNFSMRPASTPIDMASQPNRAHSDLEVIIRWPREGPLLVKVSAEDGKPLVLLYRGQLSKGKWAFDWDGRLSNGQFAPPGHYQIQAVSGSSSQTKNVFIHQRNRAENQR